MSAITRTDFTRQYEHVAAIAHGAHPEYRLEFDAFVKNEATSKGIYQGSVVSLNADGEYIIGCTAGTGMNFPVPCISMKNIFDPDVTAGVQGKTYQSSTYSAIGGKITAIPCTGGYEIETTEFKTDSTYHPNDALTALTGDDIGKIGLATKQPGDTEPYVGFVSQVPYTDRNTNGVRLSFWTNFIPARFATASGA